MPQHYSRPSRESDPHALPDVETFYLSAEEFSKADPDTWMADVVAEGGDPRELAGWYYWPCLPGCLPDGDPTGPFPTEHDALMDAREFYDDGEEC